MRRHVLAAALALVACKPREEPKQRAGSDRSDTTSLLQPAGSAGSAGSAATPPPAAKDVVKVEGFATPESVFFDLAQDVYLVSNINGSPAAKDDNGFISKVSPDGKILELRWIDGANDDVTLNAPKGLAVMGDVLYVADIDTVRRFDARTGAPRGETALPGATFINDVAVDSGTLLVTDSGLTPDFEPSGTDAVYALDQDGKVGKATKDGKLGGPNGVAEDGYVVTGARQLLRVRPGTPAVVVAELPTGQLDGVIHLGDGRLAISSWECKCIYAGPPSGPFETIVTDVPSPADLGWDPKRKRILVPIFTEDRIELHPL